MDLVLHGPVGVLTVTPDDAAEEPPMLEDVDPVPVAVPDEAVLGAAEVLEAAVDAACFFAAETIELACLLALDV